MKGKLTPHVCSDRQTPIHKLNNTTGRLIRSLTNIAFQQLKNCIGELFLVLMDEDGEYFQSLSFAHGTSSNPVIYTQVNRIIEYAGYGNLAGYLATRNLSIGPLSAATEPNSNKAINPITGAYFDDETISAFDNMTMEEKEREAERMFVLFDRLNKTKIIKVENPFSEEVLRKADERARREEAAKEEEGDD